MWIRRLLVTLLVLGLLAAAYFWAALQWSYSTGERAGWVQKFSKKGWICKTWEGEAALVSLPGSTPEKFLFTVHDEAVAQQLTTNIGKRMSLHYEEKVGLPTRCFGDTRHFVTRVTLADEIPFGPGLSFPTGPGAAPGTSGAPGAPGALPSGASGAPPTTSPAPSAPAASR